jgi:Flp pilus assembly protein CpaB
MSHRASHPGEDRASHPGEGPASARPAVETTPSWAAGVRRRIPFYLALAFLAAALAGVLAFIYLDRLRSSSVPTRSAIVARQDLRPGTLLDETMIESRPVPEAILPANALASVADAAGRVVIVPLAANEVLLTSKLSGGELGLSSRLPDGRWALLLPEGWLATPLPDLRAGDHLDLLAYQPGAPSSDAGVIVTAVEVLEPQDETEAAGLALAVSLDQAAAIAYARGNGFLILPLLRPEGS